MSLKIVYGVANSGKTEYCFNQIDDIVNNTKNNVICIVPDQYSLDTERAVSARFSKSAMDRVEVLSFDRLASRVFSRVGPVICDYLDDTAKLMVVERCLIKLSSKLTYFTKSAEAAGFASVIFDVIKSFKSNCITPEMLGDLMQNTYNVALKYKLYDLSLIYTEYNKFFVGPFADSDDNLDVLCKKIEKHNLFNDTYFIIDNFMSFSKQQLNVISSLMVHSKGVMVTLTADDLNYKNDFEIFYKSKLTAKRLFEIAYETNTEVLPNTYLQESYTRNAELKHLAQNYFAKSPVVYADETNSIAVCKSQSYNKEIEQVATEISRLVREDGYRFRDIAVITRDVDVYAPIIKDTFERYNIFYNITEQQLASKNYIFSALISVFEIVRTNYAFEAVFDFIRSPLCLLEEDEKFLLENYVIEAGNTPSMWDLSKEIVFKGSFTDFEFARIKKSLTFVRKCISAFTDKFNGRKTVTDICDGFSAFLYYIKAEDTVVNLIKLHRRNGDKQTADEVEAVYNAFISAINKMNTYFGDVSITFEKFYKILASGIAQQELERLPSGVDDVEVNTIDRFAGSKAKVVFVVGTTEGSIPCGYVNEGMLKDDELKLLGIDDNTVRVHCDENYIIYRMFVCAEDKLYISYPMSDNEGEKTTPSSVVRKIYKVFPKVKELQNIYIKSNYLQEIEGVISTFNKVVENGEKGFWKEAEKWYKTNRPDLYDIMLNAQNYTNQPAKLFEATVKNLYGTEINSSISRIEKYNQCAFSYFIRYGLNVDVRNEFKIEARDYGTYFHEIIEKYSLFAKDYGWSDITEELCHQKAVEITYSVLNENLSEYYTESDRYKYLFGKISDSMKTVLWSITEFYQESEYVSLGYEVAFSDNGDFAPIEIQLKNGTKVQLRGKVDRADVRRTADGNFVSIVDYKSGDKDIEFEKIVMGIQIQLPVYIDAICKGLEGKGETAVPAAMLYYHIASPVISGDTGEIADEKLQKSIKDKLKMKGIYSDDGSMPSVYVVKKGATANKLDKLCKVAYKKVVSSLEKIVDGDISVNPVSNNKTSGCDYCPYGNICNFDTEFKDNKHRYYKDMKMEEFFAYVDEMDS